MNDAQLTAIIIGITGILRTRLPAIDGIIVPAVAMVVGAGLSAASDPLHWREALVHGFGVGLAAVGGMTVIGYAGSKFGAGSGDPPATPTDVIAPTKPGG